jgi:hypothetical protein
MGGRQTDGKWVVVVICDVKSVELIEVTGMSFRSYCTYLTAWLDRYLGRYSTYFQSPV